MPKTKSNPRPKRNQRDAEPTREQQESDGSVDRELDDVDTSKYVAAPRKR